MSESPGWKWLGRAADIVQLWPVVAAFGLIVAAALNGEDIAGAVGGEPVLVGIVGVLGVVGLLMVIGGVAGRSDLRKVFRPDRGRWDSIVLLVGGVLVGIALVLVLVAF
ncbi:hypothetical protein [Actinophytocola sp.]|uniref:hypothetical protein n=1 Tax=Actinophytocola sp. TaxID=1872138 RepID=UPI003D6A1E86